MLLDLNSHTKRKVHPPSILRFCVSLEFLMHDITHCHYLRNKNQDKNVETLCEKLLY